MGTGLDAIKQQIMLVKLVMKEPKMSAIDPIMGKELAKKYKGDPKMFKGQRILYPPEAVRQIKSIHTKIRNTHYDMTVHWGERGWQAIPTSLFEKYRETMDPMIMEAQGLHKEWCKPDNVKRVVEQAKTLLGDRFDESDYPSPERMLECFEVDIVPAKVPDSTDFRIDLPARLLDEARSKIDKNADESIHDMHRAIWEDVYKKLSHLLDAFKKEIHLNEVGRGRGDKGFHQSTLDKITALPDILDALNVMSDSQLTELAQDMRLNLNNIDAKEIKENDIELEDKATVAEKLVKKAEAKLEAFNL